MNTLKNIPKIFLSFLATSFLMWFLINLSKEYKTEIVFNVTYENLPQEKVFREEPVNQIKLLIKGNGFKLFSTNLFSKNVVVSLDKYKRKKRKYYLLTEEQKPLLQEQLKSGLELLDIVQDTIHLNLGTFRTKKVPIKFTNAIKFKPGYGLSDVKIQPDSVLISGPQDEIELITSITTKNVNLEEVSEDVKIKIELDLSSGFENIKLSDNSVEAQIFTDKYTEGTFELPVTIINKPAELDFKIYPKKVTVTYKVGLKNYSKITEESFEVICDYKSSEEKGLTYLVPTFKKKSNLVSSVRITPQKIDFLIQK
ncbi:YbbR-like domain-containing protein [Tenacibaculum sp. MEBiC06402]|uniref:CdaR family protein n=1 Tax=unclassified Tenacibaculum TaxID=2635139 RepID=UPI003B990585